MAHKHDRTLAVRVAASSQFESIKEIISPILQAVGTVMFGLGGLLAGLGGFFYLRRRPKA